jgi:hypothetical protein
MTTETTLTERGKTEPRRKGRLVFPIVAVLLLPASTWAGPCDTIQFTIGPQVDRRELLDCIKELKFASTLSQMTIDNLSRQTDLLERSICFLANDLKQVNPNSSAASIYGGDCSPAPTKPKKKTLRATPREQ